MIVHCLGLISMTVKESVKEPWWKIKSVFDFGRFALASIISLYLLARWNLLDWGLIGIVGLWAYILVQNSKGEKQNS